jgi:UDP-N-acetylmuramoyl-L-alanyl-D-glutamate--2,6-diaminopimelate ligase
MLLRDLLSDLPHFAQIPAQQAAIAGITDDSRRVAPGFLFVAVPGLTVDGHRFIPAAVEAGAAAVVGERPAAELPLPPGFPYLRVDDAREALGWLHAAWRGFPSRSLTLIGVTGTDGKTTTTNLIYAMLRAAGIKAGMVSTVSAQIGDQSYDTGLHTTTPVAGEVQHYLAQMVEAGTTHAVLESTSHGLAQRRLAGCDFDVAVVTNITHEHLDYHGSWEAYREAKAQLFRGLMTAYRKADQPKIAVLNRQDPGAFDYLREIPVDRRVTYAIRDVDFDAVGTAPSAAEPEVIAEEVRFTPQGLAFTLRSAWGDGEFRSPLVGAFNVSNILAAASAALALDLPFAAVVQGVSAVQGVPGRMERIDEGQPFLAIVDFAHTPNALRRALETGRQMAGPGGRVIAVLGCAGLRDRAKRRMMGDVAGELADLTVVTAEDPRTESLAAIMAETALGLEAFGRREGVDYWRVPDRGAAMRRAVDMARPGDVILACGKGHEQSMCFGECEYPWDDREALRRALRGQTLDTLPTAESGGI